MPSKVPASDSTPDGVKLMAKIYREGRMKFLKDNPDASEIETVEAGIEHMLKARDEVSRG